MVKTAKNRKLKKIIAGVAATTMVIAAGSALAVSATNHTFVATKDFQVNGSDWYNIYKANFEGTNKAVAYNYFLLQKNVAGKSTIRISGSGVVDVKKTDSFDAGNQRYVMSTKVPSLARYPYSMNMAITRGSEQIDNYYTAL